MEKDGEDRSCIGVLKISGVDVYLYFRKGDYHTVFYTWKAITPEGTMGLTMPYSTEYKEPHIIAEEAAMAVTTLINNARETLESNTKITKDGGNQ